VLGIVSCAAVCIAFAACGGSGDKAAASGAEGVPDVADASAVPDAKGGDGGVGDADLRELEGYRLTMEDVKRWGAANASFARLAKKLKAENPDAGEDDGEELGPNATFDDMEASIERVPGAREAAEEAGMSLHEYVVISWALMQARVADMAVEQGANPKELAANAHIHPDNVTFVREHRAEIEKLQPAG
jgi:hypothetical protein